MMATAGRKVGDKSSFERLSIVLNTFTLPRHANPSSPPLHYLLPSSSRRLVNQQVTVKVQLAYDTV